MFRWRHLILPLLLLLPAACAQDPFERPDTWAPLGTNDANLRAMVANPQDLVAGRSETGSVGEESARPVKRLLAGKRQPLPTSGASDIGLVATPANGGNDAGESK